MLCFGFSFTKRRVVSLPQEQVFPERRQLCFLHPIKEGETLGLFRGSCAPGNTCVLTYVYARERTYSSRGHSDRQGAAQARRSPGGGGRAAVPAAAAAGGAALPGGRRGLRAQEKAPRERALGGGLLRPGAARVGASAPGARRRSAPAGPRPAGGAGAARSRVPLQRSSAGTAATQ